MILLLKLVLCVAALGAAAAAKPNMVLVLADDCTRFDLGAYGSKDSRTPTIDRLAAQGMRFTNSHQAAPTCSPTRHNLYTGLHPFRTGAYPNHTFAKPEVRSVVHHLRPLGYRVALAGKRHIGPDAVFPFEHLDNDNDPDFSAVDAFLGQAATARQPFCLFLASNQPHSPWDKGNRSLFDERTLTLPPHYVDNPETRRNYRNYLAEINFLDGQLKTALDLLAKHGLSDSTVVFFASEQGTSMPFAKWTCYNAGLGTALIVRWPGQVAPGSVSDALVDYSDVVPTFIDIAGGAPVAGLDGSTLAPLLRGQVSRHKDLSYGMMNTRGINGGSEYFPIRSILDGRFRLIVNYAPEVDFLNVAEMPGWVQAAATDPKAAALVRRYRERPALELYDDSRDPWNLTNLAGDAAHDSVRARLSGKLSQRLRDLGDDPLRTELLTFERMHKRPYNGDSVIIIQKASPATELRNVSAGIRFAVYNGSWTSLPDLSTLTPSRAATVEDFNRTASLPGRTGNRYAVRYSGHVEATVRGYHTFYLNSYNPARLSIDGKLIVTAPLNQAASRIPRRYGSILLDSGRHAIEVDYLGSPDKDSLSVTWSYPGLIEAEGDLHIPADRLAQGEIVPTGGMPVAPGRAGQAGVRGNRLLFPSGRVDCGAGICSLEGRCRRHE